MTIKKPMINKPTITKPAAKVTSKPSVGSLGIKKPSIGGVKKPNDIASQTAKEAIKDAVEVEVTEVAPVVEVVEVVEPNKAIEEVKQETQETKETKEEIKYNKEETKPNNTIIEEEIVNEEVKEVVEEKSNRKTTEKKSSRKTTKAKQPQEVDNTQEEVVELLPNMELSEAITEVFKVTNITTPEWEETKAEIKEKIESMAIDPDATLGEMKELIAQIDMTLSQLKIMKIDIEQENNGLLEHIDYVRLQGSKGTNAEERKVNGYRAMMNYKVNPDDTKSVNLLDIKIYATNKIDFISEMINILLDKKALLITFSGIVKVESQLGGY